MAYQTGTAIGGIGIFGALNAWLTGSAGWTLHDNLGAHDKVFKSTGVGGKQNHYVRLTVGSQKILDFQSGSGTFAVGDTVTGGTSGATAQIVRVPSAGVAVGCLVVVDLLGAFVNSETITGTGGGSATLTLPVRFSTLANQYSCMAATTANITLSGLQSIDGYSIAANERILVKNQTTASQNGVYLSNASSWTRVPDFSVGNDGYVAQGYFAHVLSGTTQSHSTWELSFATAPVIGTSSITFIASTRSSGFRDPRDIHNAADWILTRCYTYWNANGHYGVNETGQWGPWYLNGPSAGIQTPSFSRADNLADAGNTKSLPTPSVINITASGSSGITSNGDLCMWDGIRKLHGLPSGQFVNLDLATLQFKSLGTSGLLGSGPGANRAANANEGPHTSGILVYDKVVDRHYIYAVQDVSTNLNAWRRWNGDTDSWESLATSSNVFFSPYALQTSSSATDTPNEIKYAWDGGDFIYVWGASTATSSTATGGFSRYSISGNSWTNLTVPPRSPGRKYGNAESGTTTQNVMHQGIYVPRGNIFGILEDIIYYYSAGGSNTTVIDRYNITNNTWNSSLTVPTNENTITGVGVDARSTMWWDDRQVATGNRFWYAPNGNNTGYAIEINWNTSTTFGASPRYIAYKPSNATTTTRQATQVINHFICKTKVRPGDLITYYFAGDADNFVVATRLPASSKFYWMCAGKLDSFYQENILTTSGTTTATIPPTAVTFNVDGPTSNFQVGDRILILDPTNGRIESSSILTIPNGTSITAVLRSTIATGSRIFVDGINTILSSDHWMFLSPYDTGGHRFDLQANQGRLKGATDTVNGNIAPSARNRSQIWPLIAYEQSPTTFKNYENRGTLKNVYLTSDNATGAPQAGSVIQGRDGKQYLVMGTPEHSRLSQDTRFLAIGPIN